MQTLLETTTGKDGEPFDVYYSKVFESRAVSSMLRNYSDLIDKGLNVGNHIPFSNDNSIIWVENNGVPVGGICFTENLNQNSVYVIFSWTEHAWKRKNVRKVCGNALDNIMRQKNLVVVAALVHVDNLVNLAVADSVGYVRKGIRIERILK